jgi:hypothetical protein
MELPPWLPEQLAALSEALDEPGTDLRAVLTVLLDDLAAAVPSFLGLTITLDVEGGPVSLTAIDPASADLAGASMSVPLDPIARGVTGTVVFYADARGAFIELAADTRRALHLDGEVTLDAHISERGSGRAAALDPIALGNVTAVNQALGVLLARGYPPEQARVELARLADQDGHTLPVAAQHLLGSASPES